MLLFYCSSQILCFSQIEGLWPLHRASLSVLFFQQHFAHFMSLCHILVTLAVFQTFSLLLYLLWWSVISNLWCYYCNCFGVPCPYETMNLIHECCTCFESSTNELILHISVLGPPYPLRHSNIGIRPNNNPTMASKCSSEKMLLISHFKSKARNDRT